MTRIGFIGLGNMGGPMAANLAAAGHEVRGYDVAPEVVKAAADTGVVPVDSAQDAASEAEVVVTMLPRGEVVRAVLLGDDGVMATMAPGGLVIDSSSIDVATTREAHEHAAAAGLAYLDAPVSGGVAGARRGTLTFMVGGDAETLERARPLLDVMGAKVAHAGGPGSGQAVKTVNQMLFGTTLAAVAEAFTLADRIGLDPTVLYDVVTSSSGDCFAIRNFCPRPGVVPGSAADAEYEPRFAASLLHKDVQLALAAAAAEGQQVPVATVAAGLFTLLAQTAGNLDCSAVIRVLPGNEGPA